MADLKQQKSAGRMHDKYLQVAQRVAVYPANLAELEDDMFTVPTGHNHRSQDMLDSPSLG